MMAGTYEVALKQIPSRKLRKRVKDFVKGNDVSVRDITGQHYSVGLERNKLILRPEENIGSHSDGGCVPVDCPHA